MRLPAQRDFGVLSSHLFSRAISSAPWPSFRWTMAACSVYQGAGSRPSPGGHPTVGSPSTTAAAPTAALRAPSAWWRSM
jgi:hypothetical protein